MTLFQPRPLAPFVVVAGQIALLVSGFLLSCISQDISLIRMAGASPWVRARTRGDAYDRGAAGGGVIKAFK